MNVWLIRARSVVTAALLVTLLENSGAGSLICRPPVFVPLPPTPPPKASSLLDGTEYKISGVNSRLPGANAPTTLKFDGVAESAGIYLVNESIRQVTNQQGQRETWVDFEFTQNPTMLLALPPGSSILANDMRQAWRVNLTDLQLPSGAETAEYYMYFTEFGTPAPFGRRRGRDSAQGTIGEHPFLDDVSVMRGSTVPLVPGDVPPGSSNALVTKFEHYFSAVHDVERGMGVPRGVDGFHVGYRLATVPEPATSVTTLLGAAASGWLIRRRGPRTKSSWRLMPAH